MNQEFKSAWVSWLVCLLLVLSIYLSIYIYICVCVCMYIYIYILSSLKLQHHRQWVAEPNNTDFKGGKYLALVFKKIFKTSNFEMVSRSQKKASSASGPSGVYTAGE